MHSVDQWEFFFLIDEKKNVFGSYCDVDNAGIEFPIREVNNILEGFHGMYAIIEFL